MSKRLKLDKAGQQQTSDKRARGELSSAAGGMACGSVANSPSSATASGGAVAAVAVADSLTESQKWMKQRAPAHTRVGHGYQVTDLPVCQPHLVEAGEDEGEGDDEQGGVAAAGAVSGGINGGGGFADLLAAASRE